jgi:hypothetical protein
MIAEVRSLIASSKRALTLHRLLSAVLARTIDGQLRPLATKRRDEPQAVINDVAGYSSYIVPASEHLSCQPGAPARSIGP